MLLYVICKECNIVQGTVYKVYDMTCSITMKVLQGMHNIYLTDISLSQKQANKKKIIGFTHLRNSAPPLSLVEVCAFLVCSLPINTEKSTLWLRMCC